RGCVGGKIARIVWIKPVPGTLRISIDVHVRTYADLEIAGRVPGLFPRATVEIGKRRKLRRRQADIGERQGQPELAGALDAILRAAGADPDGQTTLHRSRRDRGILQRRTETALPGDP